MIDWTAIVGFQWDTGNRSKSLTKHQVSCEEGEQVFANQPLIVIADPKHSGREIRYHALGRTHQARLLHVSFTIRKDRLRLISVRPMNRKEKTIYEKET